jgi:hypothetical protein
MVYDVLSDHPGELFSVARLAVHVIANEGLAPTGATVNQVRAGAGELALGGLADVHMLRIRRQPEISMQYRLRPAEAEPSDLVTVGLVDSAASPSRIAFSREDQTVPMPNVAAGIISLLSLGVRPQSFASIQADVNRLRLRRVPFGPAAVHEALVQLGGLGVIERKHTGVWRPRIFYGILPGMQATLGQQVF